MAQKQAIVTGTLPNAIASPVDFTVSGFGTVTAAIIICQRAYTASNPATDYGGMSIGFWDGTTQKVCMFQSRATGTGAGEGRTSYGGVAVTYTSSGLNKFQASAITDGIRITMTLDNTTVDSYCTVLLIGGITNKKVGQIVMAPSVGNTTNSPSLGFAPKSVLFLTVGNASESTDNNAHSVFSFGMARQSDGRHRMVATGHPNAANPTRCTMLYNETYCIGQIFDEAISWRASVTTWGSDTFTLTNSADGATGGDYIFFLAFDSELSFDLVSVTTPASATTDEIATTVEPDVVLLAMTSATSTSLQTGDGAEAMCIGMADGTNEYSHGTVTEDAASTVDGESRYSAAAILDLNSAGGGTISASADATVSAFGGSSFTLNYSAVPATPVKGFALVLGPAAGGGGFFELKPPGAASGAGVIYSLRP